MKKNNNILISGASIAGPALAYWLRQYGARVTVVERTPSLRAGGHAVDFRGPAHMHVLERMGVLDAIRQLQTHMGDTSIVDMASKPLVTLPARFNAGEVEIQRGDLARILYEATRHATEYIFDDCITRLSEHATGVDVSFERNAARTFDLVIGADGLHSGVRALSFGEESRFMRFHGYYVAGFSAPNHLQLDHRGLIDSVPKRAVSISSARQRDRAIVLFVFASHPLEYDRRDVAQQKAIVAEAYAQLGWEVPRLLDAMWQAPELYFDSISQVDMEHYSTGRVALVGDAAYGGTRRECRALDGESTVANAIT